MKSLTCFSVQLAMEHLLGDQFMPQGYGPHVENIVRFPRPRRRLRRVDLNMPRVFRPDFEAEFFNRPAPIPMYPHENRRYPNFRLAGDPPRVAPPNFPQHADFGLGPNPFPFIVLPPGVRMQDIIPDDPVHREPDNPEFRPAEEGNQQVEILRGILPMGLLNRQLLLQRRRQNPGA